MASVKTSKVNPKYKRKYRVRNWAAYERGLRDRGDVTVWLSEEAIEAWIPSPTGRRGGQPRDSNLAIVTALTLRVVFRSAAPPDRGLPCVAVPPAGVGPRCPRSHDALSPQPDCGRPGAAPCPRRPDAPDRRLQRAEDLRRRQMELAQAQKGQGPERLAEAPHRRRWRRLRRGRGAHGEYKGRCGRTP